ncbi:MAG: BNR-4 repeat-containing protein [Bacteroidota bacterium]
MITNIPSIISYILLSSWLLHSTGQSTQRLNNTSIDGYRGIWFELGQKYQHGDKYSGPLGTYTAKHVPLAIFAKEVDKTFFVYGGTLSSDSRHLLCMIGVYDHQTGKVSKPTVVHDKEGVDDPHDNPSLMIDSEGYLWVFISGRGRTRPGYKYRSKAPYNIREFEQMREEEMTYPQPWNTQDGFFHFFTKYTGVRQLYIEKSLDGINWSDDQLLAAIPVNPYEKSGHYQISNVYQEKVLATFFNRHPNGIVDRRTDLYYIQSHDMGKSWTTVDGKTLAIPLANQKSPARVVDYASQSKNIYLKDMDFDPQGNPICLYIRSYGHEPGPRSAPYQWCITKWNGEAWETTLITTSDHNYDMGSLFINEEKWRVVGPTEPGPQEWGVGGELAVWVSEDLGKTWKKERDLTRSSLMSHAYVRRPINYQAPFCFFWANGDAHHFSKSELFFGDFQGNIWKLPYKMHKDWEKPVLIN